jgi:hypothetical protein
MYAKVRALVSRATAVVISNANREQQAVVSLSKTLQA